MNKIFKTKYDVTTGQTKAVSELANNRQVASRVEAAGNQPKCGGFLGNVLTVFKFAPLALFVCGLLPNVGYSENVWIDNNVANGSNGDNESTAVWYSNGNLTNPKTSKKENILLSSPNNKTGSKTNLSNKDFKETVVIGSRAVGGGNSATSIGYRAIVGKNLASDNIRNESHQGTAVGYRAFSYGNEAVSLGNDTVAYGESSISIGSDNVGKGIGKYAKKGLSYEIWKLYRQNGSKFNYTGEYAAIDGADSDTSHDKYRAYLKETNTNKPFYKTHNWAYGDSSITIGSRNVAYGHGSTAIGTLSVAKGNYSTALGTATLAFGESSVALGNESYVYADNSIGVGNNVQAISIGSMVYGYQSYAGGLGSIAIGKRALSNVEPSPDFKETVESYGQEWYEGASTESELQKLDTPQIGGKSKNLDQYFTPATVKQDGTEEEKAKVKNGGALAIGYYVYALGENSIALGRQAYSKGSRSIAIGPYAYGGYDKTIAIGYGAKALANQSFAIGSLSRAEGQDSIAFGVNSKVLKKNDSDLSGQNSVALGNNSEVTMKNSVAIGNMSNTRYYYKGDKSNPIPYNNNNNNNAIALSPYIPKGTSYNYQSTSDDGVVSVGGWDKNGDIGRRRIINVAPGALDSDAATVGQLKALEYAYKEGVVAYYTVQNGKNYKVIKDAKGDFYKANTENGTPLDSTKISANEVFVGPKGENEQTRSENGKNIIDMGDKIKFAHIKDGEIKDNSDHAITGNQLKNVGDILGISNTTNNTKFANPSFADVKYVGGNKGAQNTFKGVIDELITAVNKGYKFSDGTRSNTFNLGSTITIKADNIGTTHKPTNLKVQLDGTSGSTPTFKIGMTETPTFENVTINQTPTSDKHVVNKKYVDNKLKDAGKSHYLSVKEPAAKAGNYNNDGAKGANSVAIGVDVQTKSDAHSAVAIGHNLSTDVKHAVVVGSNINIEQNNSGDKNKKDAVVAIGSGLKLKNAKSSIVLAAVDERSNTNDTEEGRTVVDGASWAVVIGNKTKVKNGSDIVALGNNIDVSDKNNNSLVILGNQATASRAFNSVVLGYKASTTLNDAIALGSNSVANRNKDVEGLNTVTGQNKSGATHGAWKSKYAALSIGKNGTETRQITGVAAGSQDTDAVNVAQLKEATTHFVSIKNTSNTSQNYANDGATGANAIAIGVETKAQSNASIAIGYGTQVLSGSNNSIAIGATNNTLPTKIENAAWAIAIGNNTKITGGNDILALGSNINVTGSGNNSLVILGNHATASSASNSVVLGSEASTTLNDAIALGSNSMANRDKDVVGLNTVTGQNKSGATHGAWKSKYAALSIGKNGTETRQITGVAAGTQDTDAVNVAQLKEATMHFVSINNGSNGSNNGNNYANDSATKVGAIAIGVGAKAQSDAAIALGYGTQVLANSNNSIAIGAVNGGSPTKIENAAWAVAIGNNTKVTGGNDILALGSNINVTKTPDTANNDVNNSLVILGNNATATNAANSVVIGKDANTTAQSAVVIGEGATATVVNSVAIGKGSKTTGDTSTNGYDPSTKTAYVGSDNVNIWKPTHGVFSVGDSSTTTRRITGVAAGSDDTDAVNVAQLKKVVSGAAKLKYAANGGADAFTDQSKHKEIDLETKGLNFKDGTYTTASVEDDGVVKFNLSQTAKNKIDGALQKTEANTQYARIDGSNITGKENNWREKLDVYTKGETKSEINAVKTELTNKIAGKADNDLSNITRQGQNNIKTYAMEAVDVQGKLGEISVSPSSSNNKKTFTVSLDGAIKTKIESIGTGKVEASNNKTVTGGEVHTAIEGAKTELNNKINEKVNTTTFDQAKAELETKIGEKVSTTTFDQAKTELTNKIGEKVSNTTFETVKTQLKTKIDGKADKSLSDINDAGRKVIKDLITVAGEDKIEVTTANDDNTSSAKKFTVKLNEDTKNKINSIGTGKVEASDNNTVTGKVVHDAIKNSKVTVKANDGDSYITVDGSKSDDINSNEFKIGLNLNTLTTKLGETFSKKTDTFGLMGNDSQAVTTTLNNTIKIEGSKSVASSQTNIYVSKNNAGDGLEIKLGDTLTGIKTVGNNDKAKISFTDDNANNEITYTVGDATETATYKFGKDGVDLGSKKITSVASGIGDVVGTTNLDNVLKGTPEETYKSNAANVEDLAKVAAAIITKGLEFEDGNGTKVNRKLGETLKLVGEKGATVASNSSTTVATAPDNITVVAKKSKTGDSEPNDTLEIRLAKDLKGIASIENIKDKSKIELKDDGIDLTTSTGKTVKVKDNALEGVNKISAVGDANANSIDLAKDSNGTKNIEITSGGKTLTIAKDGTNGKEGISLTGLVDRKVDETGYGTNGNAGRAATEAAVLDLKTKGLTFAVNEKNTDSNPKTLKRELGETLKITGKEAVIENFDTTYSLDNIATKIDGNNNAIRIGLLKTPRFDALELGADSTKKISLTPDFANGNELKLTLTGTGAGTNTKVKISGVANGTDDNDAINKSQLNSVVTALGGSATIGTDGKVTGPTYTLANGGAKTAVGEALTALDTAITTLGNASIKFSDGTNEFTRANNESDKTVKIVSESKNVTVSLDNTADSNKTGKFTISLNKELTDINSITLKSSGDANANSKTGKITVDTTGNVKVQHGEGTASKIVAESDFNELKTSEEITVTGGGKVFGAETKLSLNDNSIAGTKLKNATISEAKLDSDLTAKLNREFKVKVDTTTSENLIGNTLEFAKDSNLTVMLDSANKKITYGLSSTLTGITSIESAAGGNGVKSKITLNADHIVSDKDIYVGSKGNDESNKLVKKSELDTLNQTLNQTLNSNQTNITKNTADIANLSNNKLTFKAGSIEFERANNSNKTVEFKGEGNLNVKLATDDSKNTGTFTISVNETSSINVEAGKQKEDGSIVKDRLTTEKAVVDYVKARTFKLAGNDSSAVSSPLDGTINIKGDASTTSDQGNIYVSKGTSDSELNIQLGKNLTGIESIKKSENGAKLTLEDNKLELSPEKDVKVTLEKDGQKTTAKATGLSTIGNDGDNALVFNTGKSDNTTATLKVGGSDLTFTKENKGIKLSGLSDGKIDDGSKDVITGNQLNDLADKLGVGVESTSKTGFTQPDFTAIKGGADSNKKQTTFKGAIDDLISAVNKGMKFQGNEQADVTVNLDGTLKIVGKGSNAKNIDVADNNIKVSKNTGGDGLEIGLSDTLTGIKSVANDENAKIALGGENGKDKTITFTSGDTPTDVTLKGSTLSGVSEINKAEGKGALKLDNATATLESAKDKSKLELKDSEAKLESAKDNSNVALKANEATVTAGADKGTLKVEANKATLESAKNGSNLALDNTGATLSAGKGAGSIKVVNNGNKKIELSPENGSTVMLKKDTTNGGVQATGLSTIGKEDSNALVFKDDNTAELKVGGNELTFTPTNGSGNAKTVKISNVADGKIENTSTDAINGKQMADLAGKLGVNVDKTSKTGFSQLSFEKVNGATNGTNPPTTFKGAIDQLITAVNGGLTFKGNDSTPTQTTLQLGGTLSIDSSAVGNGMTGATGTTVEKDITVTLKPSNVNDPQSAGTLTLTLNKATAVSDKNEKVITSKAVAEELTKYTTTETLDKDFLKVTGENIGDDTEEKKKQGRKTFGSNVGIAEIKLAGPDKSSTELVQADAVIKYLKGTGEKSVKVSDNPETKAEGEGSIAIGDKAIAQNEGAISIGQNSGAKNNGAISIGKGSDVTEKDGIAIGTGTKVSGQSSVALGEGNKVSGVQSYVIGSDNDIKGREVVAIGSNITADEKIHDAVILGKGSTGEANTVSVGSKDTKRRIIFVDTPTGEYDAVNKKYVDDLTLTYKSSNGEDKTKQTINLKNGALDFVKSENISVSVKADGEITHTLNNELKEIGSISATKDEKGAKITLSKPDTSPDTSKTYEKYVSFNEAKIKDILDGTISSDSKDAVTGKQLADLAKQLGVDVNTSDKTKFNALIFEHLSNVDGSFNNNPTTLKGAIDEARAKLNEGLKFGGDVPTGKNNGTHYLGSTINIVRLGTPTGTSATTVQPSIADYSGSNLITQYTYDKGNAKIEIGFKDAPSFNKVTLSAPQTYGNSNIGNEDLITKSYLEQALNSFKFNVEYGTEKVQIGRGDTLKFADGLNIQGKLKQEGATPAAPAPTPTAPTPTAPASVATGGTAGTVSNATALVTIGTTEALKNITLISSRPKDESADGSGASSSAGGNGAGSTGKVTKLTLDPTDGATFQVGNTGAKVNINDEGIALMPQGANGANSSPVEIPSITINAGSKPVDSNSIDLLDPANGPSIAFTAKSGSNGSAKEGTGTIKYLKDRTVSKKNSNGDKYGEGDNKGNAATEGAVKELYDSGLKFAGNDGEVHKKLGETLSIKGEGTVGETAADNIVVRTKDNGLEIGLTKNIRNIDTISIAGTGDDSGKDIFIDAEGMTTTAKLDDGTVLVNNQTASGNVLRSGTHQTEVKAGEVAIKDKSGQEIVSLKVAENTNGQGNNGGNAQSATLAFATTGTDGQSGTGSITGLADLAEDADGTSATNKNYVDGKVSDLDSNRPFDFYVKEGEKEIKVVKGRDGKFYKPEDLKGAKYVAGTADGDKGKYTKNGQDVKSSIADKQAAVVIKAEPTTSPMTITNVKDGDLTNTSTDAINGGQLVKATGAKWIDDPNSSETAPKPKIMVFADGKDGLSGLEKTSDSKKPMAMKGLTGEDGLNGQNANDKANALRNGEAGVVIFTNDKGERLVKANDGKYYKAGDVEANGTPKAGSAVAKPQLSLVNHEGNTTTPTVLGNVASGLELADPETDPKKVEEAKEKTAQLANAVENKKVEVSDKAKALSDKAKTFTRLTLAVNDLEQAANALPDGKAKAQIEAQLKETQEELAKAQKALETAKTDLQTAQESLKIANADYEANYDGYAKVADLVSADSTAVLSNVATIADVQAVAKSGMKFKGNDGVEVRKQLSETLAITGEGTFNSDLTAAGNIKVEMSQDGKGLEVKLSDKLQNMTSFETREVNGRKSTLNSDGLSVVDQDSEAVVTAQGTRIAGKGNHAGQSASYTLDGIALKDKNGKDAVSLNAKALSFAVTQDQAGAPVGTGVITGLKDLDATADGSSAANKNYVDEKVSDLDSNRPFDFYIQEGDDYTKVVKGRDGKFYKPEDLKGAKYVAGTADGDKGKYTKNGQDVKSSIADKQAAVVIKAEPTTSPMTITNVKDGDLTNTSTDAINGGQLVKATGAKFIDDPSSTTDPKAKKMVFADGKDGLSGLEKTSDGKESMANKGLTAKDGLNGKNANDKANALRNGEAGTVVFTDKDGNRLVKANDGKYYKATDVDDKGNVKSAANGQVAPKVVDNPQLSLVNTGGEINKAVVLSNVASGLELTTPTDDKKETLNKLADTVKEKVKALGEKTKELSDKATKLADLELMVDSLKQTVDTLPDGEAKDKIREELKNYEPQLSAAKEAKENAKKAVKSARDALIAANKDYKKQYNDYSKATEKVADLVKPDSKANPTNVATVGDLQAVARAGLNFEGNDGIAVHQDVGETLTLKGEGEFNSDNSAAGNIKVEMAKDGRGLEVKLSDKLKNMTSFETREVDGKTSRLDSNGLRVVDKDSEAVVTAQGTRIAGKGNHAGKSASYTLDGIALKDKNGKDAVSLNAKALSFAVTQDQAGAPVGTGVIRGLKDLDAHATGDMAANKNYVDAKHHELRHALNHSNKELRAGIAGANAASALASVSMPGKSMVAVAAAGYDGENAVAIGYSRVSDSGKVMLKLQGNSNSQGKVAGAVSVGYQW